MNEVYREAILMSKPKNSLNFSLHFIIVCPPAVSPSGFDSEDESSSNSFSEKIGSLHPAMFSVVTSKDI